MTNPQGEIGLGPPIGQSPSELSLEDLDAPDPRTRSGLRDQAMLYLGFAAGLRLSELVGLRLDDIELDGPHLSGVPPWQENATATKQDFRSVTI